MSTWLLKFLGDWSQKTGSIVWSRTHLAFHGLSSPGWMLIAVIVLAAFAIYLYTREPSEISAVRRYFLAGCRILFFALLLLLIAQPTMTLTLAGSIRQGLLILVDTSKSMGIADLRIAPEDQKRAAIAAGSIDPSRGLDQPAPEDPAYNHVARIDLVKAALTNPKIELLRRLGAKYDLFPFVFDDTLRDAGASSPTASTNPATPAAPAAENEAPAAVDTNWPATLDAKGDATALGDALENLIYRKRGQPLAGVLVITDGCSNTGTSPVDAAHAAAAEHLPVYAYGVGISDPRDIIVSNVFVQDAAFVRDTVTVTVQVRGQNLKGESGRLTLTLGNKQVAEQVVTFADNNDQNVELKFAPDQIGDFDLTAKIEPRPDEVSADNNTATHRLRVIDGRIHVLHVEDRPRFEYKFLQSQLLRDRRIDYKAILFSADPGLTSGNDTPFLKHFPDRKELLSYDLVIIGDVDPDHLGQVALTDLKDFVSKFGGSVAVIAGRDFMPSGYRRSALAQILPVEVDTPQLASLDTFDRPIKMELTQIGNDNAMFQLADSPEKNQKVWNTLPPLYWEYRVSVPKPGAQVMVVDTDAAKSSRFGKMPLIALQQYGLGQSLWIGTDNLWRMRRNTDDVLYNRLWGQIVERMALGHLLGAAKRTEITMDKQTYAAGDRVSVYARLYDRDFTPMTRPTVTGTIRKAGGGAGGSYTLNRLPGQEAMYRGDFVAPPPGTYKLGVETDPDANVALNVTQPNIEMADTAMNEAGLRALATDTGGLFVREEDLSTLPDKISATSQPVYSTVDVDLWDSPLFFAVITLVVCTEWLGRRLLQLR
jgi:hypothetical protein